MTAWEHETWVKLYRQDSADWLDWTWKGRAVFCLLLRKVDRCGRYDLGRRDDAGYYVAKLIDMDWDLVAEGLNELLSTETVRIVSLENGSRALEIPNYTRAHPRPKTATERVRKHRAKQRAKEAETICNDGTFHETGNAEREKEREKERKKERERSIARARENGGQDPHLAWNQLAAELQQLGPLRGGSAVNWRGPMPAGYPFALELMGSNKAILSRLAATHRRLSASSDHGDRKWYGRRLLGSQASVERLNAEPILAEVVGPMQPQALTAQDVLGDGWE